MSDEEYKPATDPGGDRPGGSRVRFERDASGVEHGIFGGSAADIERSILEDTAVNSHLLNQRIVRVRTTKDALGAGALTEITLTLDSGLTVKISGNGMPIGIEISK